MSDGSAERGQKRNEKTLESKQINVQYKRYYVDVNENQRGRYVKIAELGTNYKSRIILTIPAAQGLNELIAKMQTTSSDTQANEKPGKEAVLLKSETLTIDGRRFYIDLKENERGRFLRVAQMPATPRQDRQQIAIPMEGIEEIHAALTEFLEKYSVGFTSEHDDTPKITTENKTFLFNVGKNDRGEYVRISEVKLNSGYRNAITIPLPALADFKKGLDQAVAQHGKQ